MCLFSNHIFKFAEKYGDVLSIRFFGLRIVVLSGYKRVKEVYVQQGENLVDRPMLPMIYDIFGDKGQFWKIKLLNW